MGSELVGESFVLVVSAGVIIYEYQRSKLKEMEKAEKANAIAAQERYELQQQLRAIHTRIEDIEERILLLLQQKEDREEKKEQEKAQAAFSAAGENLLHFLHWWKK